MRTHWNKMPKSRKGGEYDQTDYNPIDWDHFHPEIRHGGGLSSENLPLVSRDEGSHNWKWYQHKLSTIDSRGVLVSKIAMGLASPQPHSTISGCQNNWIIPIWPQNSEWRPRETSPTTCIWKAVMHSEQRKRFKDLLHTLYIFTLEIRVATKKQNESNTQSP